MDASPPACAVCCEDFNRARRQRVRCQHCAFEACSTCVQTYILSLPEAARCMNPDCGREFSRRFLHGALSAAFVNGSYKRHLETLLFDRQRALLPAMQLEIELERATKALRLQRAALYAPQATVDGVTMVIRRAAVGARFQLLEDGTHTPADVMAMTDEDAVNESWRQEQRQEHVAVPDDAEPKAKAPPPFVRKCPEAGCNGFLSQTTVQKARRWTCGMCAARVCPDCHELVVRGTATAACGSEAVEQHDTGKARAQDQGEQGHACREEDLATARLLAKDSKACPRCASMIFRVSGCAQMWCTVCNSAFDWTTGRELQAGAPLHNPHYFDWLRTRGGAGGDPAPAPAPAMPCGGGQPNVRHLSMHRVFGMADECQDANELLAAYRLLLHVHDEEVGRRYADRRESGFGPTDGNADLRRAFLLGEMDEPKFRAMLQRREKSRLRKADLLQVFQTFEQVATDIIAEATQGPLTSQLASDCMRDLRAIRDFTNGGLRDVCAGFAGTVAPRITDQWEMARAPVT